MDQLWITKVHTSAKRKIVKSISMARTIGGVKDGVCRIRILLVGVPRMLNEIIHSTIASEPDMKIAEDAARFDGELGAYTRRRRIDVVIFVAGDEKFADDKILEMLRTNPRLSLVSVDGKNDRGTLHRLAPAHDAIGRLAQSGLTAAIRAGAALRLN